MPSSLNLAGVFTDAIAEHLSIIRQFEAQQDAFERQVDALCSPGDVVIGISTSGDGQNVCAALQRAHELKAWTVAMTGQSGGRIAALADVCLHVPSTDAARIQECHILCGHILCEWVELATCVSRAVAAPGDVR